MLSRSRRSVRALVAVASGLTALSFQTTAAAEEALPLRIDLAAESCPSADRPSRASLIEDLRSRVRRPVVVVDEAPAALSIRLAPERDRWVGVATFEGASGRDARVIEAVSCSVVAHALAFVASAWIEAEPERHAAEPAPLTDADTERSRPRPRPRPQPRTERTTPSTRQAGPLHPNLGMAWRSGVTVGFVDRVALDGSVSLVLALAGGRELRGGLHIALSKAEAVRGEATYAWFTAPVEACQNLGRRTTLGLCARAEGGVFHAAISGPANFEARHYLTWLDVGVGLRVGGPIGKVRLEAESFARTPVTGYRLEPASARVVGFRSFGLSFGIGASVPIW